MKLKIEVKSQVMKCGMENTRRDVLIRGISWAHIWGWFMVGLGDAEVN